MMAWSQVLTSKETSTKIIRVHAALEVLEKPWNLILDFKGTWKALKKRILGKTAWKLLEFLLGWKLLRLHHAKLKETFQKLSPKLTIRETLKPKIKMSMRALNLQDVVRNIKGGFFSKENTETLCMA